MIGEPMSKLIINSEGDIERSLEEIKKIANWDGRKDLTLVLPSEGMWEIFKTELYKVLSDDSVKKPVDIDADIIVL